MPNDYHEQTPEDRAHKARIEAKGRMEWLEDEQRRHDDPWFASLGHPPSAPTWELEWEAARDRIEAGLCGGPNASLMLEAKNGATIEVSAAEVTIKLAL
jgi:hypothetical protein